MKKTVFIITIAVLALPLLAAAQKGIDITQITPYSDKIIYVVNYMLVPVLMALAFIVFLWGVFKYFILGSADEKNRAEGRQFVLWGIVGFVIILSLWGIVNLVMGTFGLSVGKAPAFPTIGGSTAPAGSPAGAVTFPAGTPPGQVRCPDGTLVSTASPCPGTVQGCGDPDAYNYVVGAIDFNSCQYRCSNGTLESSRAACNAIVP